MATTSTHPRVPRQTVKRPRESSDTTKLCCGTWSILLFQVTGSHWRSAKPDQGADPHRSVQGLALRPPHHLTHRVCLSKWKCNASVNGAGSRASRHGKTTCRKLAPPGQSHLGLDGRAKGIGCHGQAKARRSLPVRLARPLHNLATSFSFTHGQALKIPPAHGTRRSIHLTHGSESRATGRRHREAPPGRRRSLPRRLLLAVRLRFLFRAVTDDLFGADQ